MTKIVTQFVRNENKKIAKLGVDILAIKAYNKYIEIKQKGKNKMNNQLIEQIVEQAEQFNSFHKVSTLLSVLKDAGNYSDIQSALDNSQTKISCRVALIDNPAYN
jgi:predicted transcriptional regulator